MTTLTMSRERYYADAFDANPFSEDIDFKMAMPEGTSHTRARQHRSAYRARILEALTAAGFTAGTPVIGDIYTGSAWKTILVGGLNSGCKGYYALDITDPDNPAALWEFTNTNMGLTYGNPVITKRKDGTWVVVVSSGLNNADGNGYLYQINAATGVSASTAPANKPAHWPAARRTAA